MKTAARRPACALAAGLALCGCTWIHPREPRPEPPATLVQPRFAEVAVDFAHRWDRETSHHLSGAAVLDVDGDGLEEIFVGGGAGQPDALLGLRDGRLRDRIAGTGLSSDVASTAFALQCLFKHGVNPSEHEDGLKFLGICTWSTTWTLRAAPWRARRDAAATLPPTGRGAAR